VKSFIPTPSHSAVALGPFTIHFYALCILAGVSAAITIGRSRYSRSGGNPDEITDVAIFAIPAGIIGGRIYHVITSPERYFGSNGHPFDAVKIWDGGMGIWGAIALGTLVAYLIFRSRERSLTFGQFADALAPGLLIAQAIGRLGNWFNGELFGGPTQLPWGLQIPSDHRPAGFESYATFHPTFLYEGLWSLICAVALIALTKRWHTQTGNLFLAYIALYCLGRSGIEYLRIDPAQQIFGLRLNEWVSLLGLILSSFTIFLRHQKYERGIIAS
jgi:prolipoprotein diacylglyceryl transferase